MDNVTEYIVKDKRQKIKEKSTEIDFIYFYMLMKRNDLSQRPLNFAVRTIKF
jgi:type IV secretory pathway component VirB8